ncbi:hypothetical protein niasHT_022294 [Heterodera trifolii]|uniref:Rho-GAP domain-containing protein n=1 Tax=Heterodera trifolii TaxID=157864 RepID=A0ABD2KNW4_9BILA
MFQQPHPSSSFVLCSSSSSLPSLADDQNTTTALSARSSPPDSLTPPSPTMANYANLRMFGDLRCSPPTTTASSSSNNDQQSSASASAVASDQHTVMMTSLGMANGRTSPTAPFSPLQVVNPCYRQVPMPSSSSASSYYTTSLNGHTQCQNDSQNHWHNLNISQHRPAAENEQNERKQHNSSVFNIDSVHQNQPPNSVVVILPTITSPKLLQQKPKVLANKRTICVQTVGNGDCHQQKLAMNRPTIIPLNTDSPESVTEESLNDDRFLRVDSMNVAVLFSPTVNDSNRWARRVRSVIRQFKDKAHLSSVNPSSSVVSDVSPCPSPSKPSSLYGMSLSSIVPLTSDASPLPRFVYDIMEWLKCRAHTSDGVFRKSGASVRIKEISEACSALSADQPIPAHLLADSSPYDVADALKQYFASLPGSLMTEEISEIVVKMVSELPEQRHFVALHHCVLLLPTEHREALTQLLRFLGTVTRLSPRMTSLCMATCWMPTLFKMPGDNKMGKLMTPDNTKRSRSSKLTRRKTICTPVLDSLDAVKRLLMTMIDQWERLLYLPNALAKLVSEDKRWKVCHDLEMPIKNGQFDFSTELQYNFRQQLSRLKADYLSSGGWENRGLKRVFPDGSQLFTRTINDMVHLKVVSVQTAIAASPNLVLAAILHSRHLWDSQVKDCQRIGPSLQNLDIMRITYKSLLGDVPEKSTFLARCWLYSELNENSSIGLLVERSVVPRNVCRHNVEKHVSVYKSEFLVVPVCSGHSYVIHISRADFRGKCSDWYDKVYGPLLVQNLRRLRQFIQSQQNGCFRRGTIV